MHSGEEGAGLRCRITSHTHPEATHCPLCDWKADTGRVEGVDTTEERLLRLESSNTVKSGRCSLHSLQREMVAVYQGVVQRAGALESDVPYMPSVRLTS